MAISMLTNNKQEVSNVEKTNVNQAQGDIIINNGISVETAMEICKNVVKAELAIYTQQATETALQRLYSISAKTIDKISELKQELLQRFNEPAIQVALNETFKSFIVSGDEELEENLIDLLIDRLNIQDRTTEQAIIDEAREIIPKLSSSTVALLAVMAFYKLLFPYDKSKYENLIKKLSPIICKIQNISVLDTEYLKQAGCCSGNRAIIVNSSIEAVLMKDYELIFRDSLSLEDFNIILQNCNTLNQIKVILSFFDIIEERMLSKIPNLNSINEQIYNTIDRITINKIFEEYKAKTRPFTEEEIRNYFISIDANWKYIFELFKSNNIQSLQLTPVGVYIGIRQLSRICEESIPMKLFFK